MTTIIQKFREDDQNVTIGAGKNLMILKWFCFFSVGDFVQVGEKNYEVIKETHSGMFYKVFKIKRVKKNLKSMLNLKSYFLGFMILCLSVNAWTYYSRYSLRDVEDSIKLKDILNEHRDLIEKNHNEIEHLKFKILQNKLR